MSKAYADKRETAFKDRYERLRLHAAITVQPHCKRRIQPESLLPFSWEKPRTRKGTSSKERLAKKLREI